MSGRTDDKRINGTVSCIDGRLSWTGEAPHRLSGEVDETFLRLLFCDEDPTSLHFVGRVTPLLSQSARADMAVAARRIGGEIWNRYAAATRKWATVTSAKREWDLSQFEIVYRQPLDPYGPDSITGIIITNAGLRFCEVAGYPLMTFAEFQCRFGVGPSERLVDRLNQHAQTVGMALDAIQSRLVNAPACVMDSDQQLSRQRVVVPLGAPLQHMQVRDGGKIVHLGD